MRVDVGIDPYKRCAGLHWCTRICGCILPGGQGRPPLQDVLRLRRTSCNFAIAFCRVDVGIDPYGDFALLPFVVRFCGCNLRGRGSPRPYVTAKPALSPFLARSSYYNISGRDVL